MVAKNQNDKNISKFVFGILVIIIYAFVLVQIRDLFIRVCHIPLSSLPFITRQIFNSSFWLYLVISCILQLLLVLTWAFYRRRYRRFLLVLFMLLTGLYIIIYMVALYLPFVFVGSYLS